MKLITTPRLAAIALATTTLGLAACNDPADDAMEQKADAVEAQAEMTADALDDQGMDAQAEAVEDAGEAKADALEEKADEIEDAN
ncbi:hypothetical protein B2G71_06205 [Novosphingobium sp. PC22D]|uniref:hypothetical protein n=1 Tax=Novosphingobium sp. PC22D TaxID=1962403 RepID=UPI000BF17323|nr:hypothetical protein [Novosphingobium sp. PC22D]PEQ13891.1 hypothetical protein B2G71_06205 [Novosphingobium sp. PC22D]